MTPQDVRSPIQQQRWVEVRNDSQDVIPPFAVLEITESERPEAESELTPGAGRTVLVVTQPTQDSIQYVVINSMQEIKAGELGWATNDFPAYALYGGGSPEAGEVWGATAGSYALSSGNTGFLIEGDADGEKVRVQKC